jgi:protein-disulfide isomerase
MFTPKYLFVVAGLLAGAVTAPAQSPVLHYSGRIAVDGTNFSGDGFFVFSLHDTNGVIFWASGDFPHAGSTNQPRAAWRLPVRDGVYRVRLGDTAAGMPALNPVPLRAAREPFLRVWFNDGKRGWRQAGDVSIKPALASNPTGPAATAANAGFSSAQADAILRELRELRAQVGKPQPTPAQPPEAPKIVTVPLGDSPSLGRADAPVALVEFTDFQCPYCKRAHDDMLAQFVKKFVDTGQARLVSRSYPLAFHANAEPAAHAALCANAQNQFWAMRDRLFANITALNTTNFLQAAAELKLDTNAFSACLTAKSFASQIARDKADAETAGINATPSFVLGRIADGKVTGPVLIGGRPITFFETEIPKLLAAAK